MEEGFDAGQVDEFIWLGSESAAHDKDSLKERNIKYILTVGSGMEPMYPKDFTYKVIQATDEPQEMLLPYFKECKKFIEESKEKESCILVHW